MTSGTLHSKIGLVGLGKMGYNLSLNLRRNGISLVVYDVAMENLKQVAGEEGIETTYSLTELVTRLPQTKILWLMVPAGKAVDEVIDKLLPYLRKGDIIIDGGNSFYKDSLRRYGALKSVGVGFLDCGTSGGLSGALNGACTMIGGEPEVFNICEPVFKAISCENGYLYTGKPGSGHFVKMVHNGIEYGMMQAIAEGFEIMQRSEYELPYEKIADVWNHGSVIRSWLMELTQNAFAKDPNLESIKGVMNSSGEGKWALETALDLGVPTPVIALSLMMRYRSQQENTFSGKLVAALRNEFGGHKVEKAGK